MATTLRGMWLARVLALLVVAALLGQAASWGLGLLSPSRLSLIQDAQRSTASSAPATPADPATWLDAGALQSAAATALREWAGEGGDTAGVTVVAGDLDGLVLGASAGSAVTVDVDAAGWGWTVAAGEMDLLTVVRHEIGHALGHGHDEGGLMAATLSPGERHAVPAVPAVPAAPAETAVEPAAPQGGESSGEQGPAVAEPAAEQAPEPVVEPADQGHAGPTLTTLTTADDSSVAVDVEADGTVMAAGPTASSGLEGAVPLTGGSLAEVEGGTVGAPGAADPPVAGQVEAPGSGSPALSESGAAADRPAGDPLADGPAAFTAAEHDVGLGSLTTVGPALGGAAVWTVVDGVATVRAGDGGTSWELEYDESTGMLLLRQDGAVTVLDLTGVTSVVLVGGAGDDLLDVVSGLPVGVSFRGGGGSDTLLGPSQDSTWSVTGPGSGHVATISFEGVEVLYGEAGNADTFVLGALAQIPGRIEGGHGGFDSVVVESGAFTTVDYAITGLQSGVVRRDGVVLVVYDGMEPVTVGAAPNVVLNAGTADDTITIVDDAVAGNGAFWVQFSGGESHYLVDTGSVSSVAIFGQGGADTLVVTSIDSAYSGTLVFDGGQGIDRIRGPDTATVWHLTGLGIGTLDPASTPIIAFTGVEDLEGALTASDSFRFGSAGAVTGTIDDHEGLLEVNVATLVWISGTGLDFVRASITDLVTTNGTTTTTSPSASVLYVAGASVDAFLGIKPFDLPLGINATVDDLVLAVVTDGTRVWHAAKGGLDGTGFVGVEGVGFALSDITVGLSTKATDGSWVDYSTTPVAVDTDGIAGTDLTLTSTTASISVSVHALLTVSDFLHVSGTFVFEPGGLGTVDVVTGLSGPTALVTAPGLALLTTSATDPTDGSLARTTDNTIIWNLPVTLLKVGASGLSVFAGYGMGDWVAGETYEIDVDGAGPAAPLVRGDVDLDGVLELGELAPGAIGVFAGDIEIALVLASGRSSLTPDLKRRFMALAATAADLAILGIPHTTLAASGIAVELNRSAAWTPGGPAPYVDWVRSYGANGLAVDTGDGTPVRITHTEAVVGVSVDYAVLQVSEYLHLSGSLALRQGVTEHVDIATGLLAGPGGTPPSAAPSLSLIPVAASDPVDGVTLGRSADYSTIYNLEVRTLTFGGSGISVFVGYGMGDWVAKATYEIDVDGDGPGAPVVRGDVNLDGVLDLDELAPGAIGVFAGGIDVGIVSARAVPLTGLQTPLNLLLPSFTAVKATADDLAILGIPLTTIAASGIAFELNTGSRWLAALPGTPAPTVDWAGSFVAGGLGVRTGTSTPDVLVDFEGDPLIGVSIDYAVLQVSEFFHLSGSFAFRQGPVEFVDVETGLLGTGTVPPSAAPALALITSVTTVATQVDEELSRSADYSKLFNVRVNTMTFGGSGLSVFVGYGMGEWVAKETYEIDVDGDGPGAPLVRGDVNLDGVLDVDELAPGAIGVFAGGIDVGVVLARAVPLTGLQVPLNLLLPSFTAVKVTADDVEILGIPATTISASGIAFELNTGSRWLAALPGTPAPTVDWLASFPDRDGTGSTATGTDAAGYEVRTGTLTPPVVIDYEGDPLIGVSIDYAVLRVSDFFHVSGSFAFRQGSVEYVDVETGLLGSGLTGTGPPSAAPSLVLIPVAASDPSNGTTLGRSADYSKLWNVRVNTMTFGGTGLSAFVGYGMGDWVAHETEVVDGNDDGDTTDLDDIRVGDANDNGILDLDEIADGAIGVFAGNIDFGLVSARAVPFTNLQLPLNLIMPSLTAVKATADDVIILGIPYTTISASGIAFELNTGSRWLAALPGTPAPTIDWVSSFPDRDGSGPTATGTDVVGYEVRTGTSTPPVVIDHEGDPLIGVSIDYAVLRVSDFFHVSGSFAFRQGPVEYVDVETGLLGSGGGNLLAPSAAPALALIPLKSGDPVDGTTLGRSADYSKLWNVRVNTMTMGGSGLSLFVGYGMGDWVAKATYGVDTNGDGDTTDALDGLRGDVDLDGVLDVGELAPGAIGVFAGNVGFGVVSARPVPFGVGDPKLPLNLIMPSFTAAKATADTITILGIPYTTISASGVAFELNTGSPWLIALPGTPAPTIDWVSSFPDRDGTGPTATGTDVVGYEVRTGTSTPPVVIDHEGDPLIGVSIDYAVLRVSDFFHVSGSFAFRQGPVEYVDVETGLLGSGGGNVLPPSAAPALGLILNVGADDPDGTTLGRSADYSKLFNVRVNTMTMGGSGLSLFVGYGMGDWVAKATYGVDTNGDGDTTDALDGLRGDVDLDGILDVGELAPGAIGVFAGNIGFGVVSARAVPFGVGDPKLPLNLLMPSFTAAKATADTITILGIPHTTISASGVAFELNTGSPWLLALPGTPAPTIDWVSSFPDRDGSGPTATGTDVVGYEVRTGTNTPPVVIDHEGDPLIGVSIDYAVLRVSEFFHISGSFAFRAGPVEYVDVETGLLGSGAGNVLPPSAAPALGLILNVGDDDPDGRTLGRSADYSKLYNVRVNTMTVGGSGLSLFVGYGMGEWVAKTRTAFDANGDGDTTDAGDFRGDVDLDGVLDVGEVARGAIGVFAGNATFGVVAARPVPFAAGDTKLPLNLLMPSFTAVKATVDTVSLLGIPHVTVSASGIAFELNTGSPWLLALPGTPAATIDWVSSFPDSDTTGPDAAGYEVRTGTNTPPVVIDYEADPLIGVSIDHAILQVSEFLHISGSFAFRQGPVENVDVATGLLGGGPGNSLTPPPNALPLGSILNVVTTDLPTSTTLGRSADYSMLYNVRVNTLALGGTGLSAFVGYGMGEWVARTRTAYDANGDGDTTDADDFRGDADLDGILDRGELAPGAIGVFAGNVAFGLVLARPVPFGVGDPLFALNAVMPSFTAMKATADDIAILGVPYVTVSATGIAFELNTGTPWLGSLPGTPAPVVDWLASFPDRDGTGPTATGTDLAGYEVRTGTTTAPVVIDYEGDPLIGVSIDYAVLRISEFLHIGGSFAFRQGPVETVDVRTGVKSLVDGVAPTTAPQLNALALMVPTDDPTGTALGRNADYSYIWNLRVNTMTVGGTGLSAFIGYGMGEWFAKTRTAFDANGDGDTTDAADWRGDVDLDGILDLDEIDSSAIGFFVGAVDFGLVMARPVPFGPTDPLVVLNPTLPSFTAIRVQADSLALLGIPGVEISGTGVRAEVNLGTSWLPGSSATGGAPPTIDWTSSFPDTDGALLVDNAGYEVRTGTSTPPVLIDADGYLIGGGAENVHIEITEYVYIDGAIYFEMGPVRTVQLADAILPISELAAKIPGIPSSFLLNEKEVSFLTIGAKDLQAFVGINGPYWVDANGNGEIDRDTTTGQIVEAETNDDAIGLVIDDLTFGLALMRPTNLADPTRYVALIGEANLVGLVGLEDYLVLRAEEVSVELNISTPLFNGFPLLPVVDFVDTFGAGGLGVKTGARHVDGTDVTVDLTMESLLVKAGIGYMSANLMDGMATLNGAIGFELGPTVDVTLADSSVKSVKVMTIGASNVYGFIGFGGPYVADSNGNGWIDRADFQPGVNGALGRPIQINSGAVGFAINDLDLGVFVGLSVETGVGGGSPEVGVYVAAHLSVGDPEHPEIPGFTFVGLPGFIATGSLGLSLNVGASSGSGFSAIDFETSFPPEDLPDPDVDIPAGYRVWTGDERNPVLLQYDDFLVKIELAGAIGMTDVFALVGFAALEVDSTGLKLLAAGQMVIGPDLASFNATTGTISTTTPPILSISALGALVINSSGVALDIDVDLELNTGIGLDLNVSARILLNTTSADQQIFLPNRIFNFLSFQAGAGGPTSVLAANLLNRLDDCTGTVAVDLRCYTISGTAPNILSGPTIGSLLNGTGPVTYVSTPGRYVVAVAGGTFNFLGFAQGTGIVGIGLSEAGGSPRFQFYFDLSFRLGTTGISIDVGAKGTVDIDRTGIDLDLAVRIDADIFSVFHLDVRGQLQINTKGSNDYFRLDVSGRLDVAGILSVSGRIIVTVGGPVLGAGKWRIEIPPAVSDRLTGSFGPVTVSAWGWIQSDGQFDVDFSASLRLGVDGFSISGTVSAGVSLVKETDGRYFFAAYLSGSVALEAFGIDIASFRVGATLSGYLGTYVELRFEACVDLFFDEACADFVLARIQLPDSIVPRGAPKLAAFPTTTSTTLVLNVGSRSGERASYASPTATVEDYRVAVLGRDDTTGLYTVRVEAFGSSEVFSGVSGITGDFGGGADTFVLSQIDRETGNPAGVGVPGGMGLPVTISGGTGNDILSYLGGGQATLNGDGDNDTLTGGRGADNLNGGSGADYLDGRGGVDVMDGGVDGDILYGAIRNVLGETLLGGGGTDTVEIVGTVDADQFSVSTATAGGVTRLVVTTTGAAAGNVTLDGAEVFLLNPKAGADTVTLNGSLVGAGIATISVLMDDGTPTTCTTAGTVQTCTPGSSVNQRDVVTMVLSGLADTLTVTGDLDPAVTSNVRGDGVTALAFTGGSSAGEVPTTRYAWSSDYTLVIVDSGAGDDDLVVVEAGAAVDTLQVDSLAANTRLLAGAGADLVEVGSNADLSGNSGGVLESIDAALEVVGGTESDTLLVDDSGEAALGQSGELTATTLNGFGLAPAGITYSDIQVLTLALGTLGDTLHVRSTSAVTAVNAGTGADTVNVSSDAPTMAGTVNLLNGALTVNGQDGDDTLNVSDDGDASVNGGSVTDVAITGYSPTAITYSSFLNLNLDLGPGANTLEIISPSATTTTADTGALADTVLVTSVAPGSTVTVSTEGAGDTVTVTSNLGTLVINGGDGGDTVTVNGSTGTLTVNGDAADDLVLVNLLSGTGAVNGGTGNDDVVVRDLQGALTVSGGADDDWLGVLTTDAGSTLTAHGGTGDDVFEVGSAAEGTTRRVIDTGGSVDGVQGAVTVNGNDPTASDWLWIDETGDTDGETGFLTATQVYGLGMAVGITYGTVEHLEIRLGATGTTFNVLSTHALTDTELEAGAGNDVINIGSTLNLLTATLDEIAGDLWIKGDGDSDTAHVSDAGDGGANTGNLTVDHLTGLGIGSSGIRYDTLELLDIDLGSGVDTLTVESTHATTTTVDSNLGADQIAVRTTDGWTTVTTGDGADVVRVGTLAPATGGTLDGIGALLEILGSADSDRLVVDDTGDSADVGTLTSTTIEGLGTRIGSAHATVASDAVHVITVVNAFDGTFTVRLGSGAWTTPLDFDASATAVRNALLAVLAGTTGLSADDIVVTRVLHDLELTLVITLVNDLGGTAGHALGAVEVDGAQLIGIDGYGDAAATGASSSTGRIVYTGFEELQLGLGSGADALQVQSTHSELTAVDAGAGNDVLLIETVDGTTRLHGAAGDDVLVVNPLSSTTNGVNGEDLVIDGDAGSDLYVVNVWSDGTSTLGISDSGTDVTGFDRLTVNGTAGNDTFLLRDFVVAALSGTSPTGGFLDAEVITYDSTIDAGLTVNTLDGADTVAFDDNSTVTTVNGGDGSDTFQVGQLFGRTHVLDILELELLGTTRGDLSNGISYATTINGGRGNDRFQVFHNLAVLQANGDAGDDEFVVRTFLGVDGATTIDSGDGRDVIDYVWNAPVAIDGGSGFDTVVVIGTEADDQFVLTESGIYGAGRFVGFVGVERVDVDGAEGDDTFTVLGTAAGVQVRLFGGLGSDHVVVGGDAGAVYSDDLLGHTGLIAHEVESSCAAATTCVPGAWNGLPVDGLAGEVVDDEEAAVVVRESGGSTVVFERLGTWSTADTYSLVLNRAPTAEVRITVSAPSRSPDDEVQRSYSVEVSLDGTTWTDAVTLVFGAIGWNTAQTVHVRAHGDFSSEGEDGVPLQHLVVSGDAAYSGMPLMNVDVRVVDDELAGVTLLLVGTDTVVAESGAVDTYQLALTRQPLSTVWLDVAAGSDVCVSVVGDANADCGVVTLEIGSGSWMDARTVTVRAAADVDVEGSHHGYVTATVRGTDRTAGTVQSVFGTRVTVVVSTPVSAHTLRGYLLRVLTGAGAGQSWPVWDNTASTCVGGVCTTVVTVQGEIETAPAPSDAVVIDGFVPPSTVDVLQGEVTGQVGGVLAVTGLPSGLATNSLVGATIRVFDGLTTDYRTVVGHTGTSITVDGSWTYAVGKSFSVVDLPGVAVPAVTVLVTDDDSRGVLIRPTDGDTRLLEDGDGMLTSLIGDTYTVVLTQAPAVGETVSVRIVPTTSETLHRTPLTAVFRDQQQLCVGTAAPTATTDSCGPITLVFTAGNWSTPQTVHVWAREDTVIDGSDRQDFADSSQRVHLVQGPLFVDGGTDPSADRSFPAPIMLPGESSGPLPPLTATSAAAIEHRQVDTLLVDNTDSVSADSGVLTSSTLTGLGMGPTQFVGGRSLPGGITYDELESLVIRLGSGNDTLTVVSTHGGTTEVTGGRGRDLFVVETVDGHTRLQGGAGDDRFLVGSTTDRLDDLDALLLLDGGADETEALVPGVGDLAVIDDSGDLDDNLGTLTQTTLTGLDMVGTSADALFSLTLGSGAVGATFTVTHSGTAFVVTPTSLTAAGIQAALQSVLFPAATCGSLSATRCSTSVYVWGHDGDFLIGFQGELHGIAVGLTVTPAGSPTGATATDVQRTEGINYYGFDTEDDLRVLLGEGDDRFNVRGTLPSTVLETRDGDDLVYVSDAATLDAFATAAAAAGRDLQALHDRVLHGTVEVDDLTFVGTLDQVTGDLDVRTGGGSNTLSISDRDDSDVDGGVVLTASTLTGLSSGDITYGTSGDLAGQGAWALLADSGLYGRGINVYTGLGGDRISVASVLAGALATSPFGATVTSLFTGGGNDAVRVTVAATVAELLLPAHALTRRLLVHGGDGNDSVNASVASLPVVLIGDAGVDTLTGGSGNDVLFGDDGRVHHTSPTSATYDVVLGGDPDASVLPVLRDAVFLTPELVLTRDITVGAGDSLNGGAGNDLLLGGKGVDTVNGGAGNDLVFGDFGRIATSAADGFVNAALLPLALALHPFAFDSTDITDDTHSAGDLLHGDAGDDILLGQQGIDTIHGDDGDDDLFGGHDVTLGHDTGDRLDGGTGNDVVVGDNGSILRTGSSLTTLVRTLTDGTLYGGVSLTADANGVLGRDVLLVDHRSDTAGNLYGADVVAGGADRDAVFGQLGDDSLHGDGQVVAGLLVTAAATTTDGDDYLEGGGGADRVYGGLGQDDLVGGSSDLFGLLLEQQRPDGADTMLGGNGDALIRSAVGGTDRGRDADVVLGDNGQVLRAGSVNGAASSYLGFVFDDLYGTGSLPLVPRVTVLLDYSPIGEAGYWFGLPGTPAGMEWRTGLGTNVGGGDFLHGEDGNDVLHGATGDDTLFGESHDDDLYGEAGEDWLSGGAGDDGLLGDDGRLYTRRNSTGSGELLYGLAALPCVSPVTGAGTAAPCHLATPGNMQVAETYVVNELHKSVELDQLVGTTSTLYVGGTDVMYGGLGNDFLHGGEGDDAMSGAEATAGYYSLDPLAYLRLVYDVAYAGLPGYDARRGVLQWGSIRLGEFYEYDELDPWHKVLVAATTVPFLLVNEAVRPDGTVVDDGKDVLFGDGGHDWVVGGTGQDRLFGGWGDDLLDVDDDPETLSGTNRAPDVRTSAPSFADIAYGGAGRDILIANTGADRLIDWVGEFNSYVVPFSPYGAATISRAVSPALQQYLLDLAAASGADVTRGGDPTRKGEPFGELGLVNQSDAAWSAQHGAPADPQAGNTRGGRDVLRNEAITTSPPAVVPAPVTVLAAAAATLPLVSVGAVRVVESDRGTSVGVTVRLSAPSAKTVTVEIRTYDGTAKAVSDYRHAVQVLTFAPGTTSVTFTVQVVGDKLREGEEWFEVRLATPSGATVGTGTARITIVDDDGTAVLAARQYVTTRTTALSSSAVVTRQARLRCEPGRTTAWSTCAGRRT